MNHKEVQDIIENIENDLEVENLNYKDVNVWPLLKFHFFWKFYKFNKVQYSNSQVKTPLNSAVKISIIQRVFFHLKFIKSFLVNSSTFFYQLFKFKLVQKKAEFLFIDTSDALYLDVENNKKISKYIFPYIDFISKKGSSVILNTLNSKLPNKERFFSVVFFNSKFYLKYIEIITFYKLKFNNVKESKIDSFNILKSYISHKQYPPVISEKFIVSEMEKILVYEKFWRKILKHIQPKVVFVECYYGVNSNYGLFLAASKLNIKIVDIQHGIALGVFYTGWQKTIHKNNILPTNYWCWSNYDALIVNTSRKSNSCFKAIVGGNLWLKKCIEENSKNDSNIIIEKLIEEKKPSKVILVTLQHSIPISEILIEAINKSPLHYLWLIRFHPFDSVDPNYRPTYINEFKNCVNVEYKNSTTANLYSLLKSVTVHVTHHSNVAVEAITFKVPTILLGNVFELIYKDYIEAKHFFVANNANQILSYLSSGITVNESNCELFKMQHEESIANSALNKIMA